MQPFRINRPKSSSPCPPLPKTGIGIEDSDDYQSLFPFENLVFEGGGIKGLAYVGALKAHRLRPYIHQEKKDEFTSSPLQVLDDIGVLQNVKRYAGSSAGATCACLLAVGCTVEQLWEFLNQDIKKELQGKQKTRAALWDARAAPPFAGVNVIGKGSHACFS